MPSVLIGEIIMSDQVSDLSALCMPGKSSQMLGIVSTSELSAVELVQSVIDKIKCPKGTDIWLGDTGASQDCSKNKVGATNICNAGQVSVGSTRQLTSYELTFDLQGQFVHHDGSLGLRAVISDVAYDSQNNFNLFSIS